MDAPTPDDAPEDLGVWTTAEIVYMSIAGVLLLMALAEIVAFTGSLTYSFIKVHQKAKAARRRGVQYTSLVILVIFWVLRLIFLAAMLSLVPIPHWQGTRHKEENHQLIPAPIIKYSQYTAFGLVGLLLVLPTVISLHQLMTSPTNIKEQLDAIRTTSTFPRVLIVMPVYNELPEVLHVAICSAIDGDYPKEHLHIFISFDNDATSDLYRALIRNLGVPADNDYYPPVLDLYFRGVQITVSRFPHGGKRLTQKKTFGLINSIYKNYPEKTDHLFVLFIDSDIVLPPATVANFMWDMQLKPGSTKDLLGMTGVITVTTKDDMSFINLLQDIEYVHGQFFGRAIESAVGACVTLPGALTVFRYSAFLKSYDEYFADATISDLWDFGRSHLGEDRYLTHLLMTKAARPKMIQFCHRATCKTEPVREWRNLMKQRRRWFLGFLTNEGAFLSDPALWRKYPWLLSFRMIQDIVNGTSMVSYATITAVVTGIQNWSWIWLGLLISYFCINWGLMFVYGFWIGRKKAFLYPMMFVVGPFVTWFLLVYGVITANERTWGGPRADASKDEEHGEGEEETGEGKGGDDYSPRDANDSSDSERIELPDHLFYPRQLRNNRHRRAGSSGDDSDVNSLDISRDVNDYGIKPNFVRTAENNDEEDRFHPVSTRNPGLYELELVSSTTRDSWEADDEDFTSGDETSSDEDADEDEGPVDLISLASSRGKGNLDEDEEYFSFQPLGFASPLLHKDTEWWESDKHLSSFGILPFVDQPKIPAMFASTETLILSAVIPAARSIRSIKSRAGTPTSFSDRRMSSASSLALVPPATPQMPGTPRRSRHGSSAAATAAAAVAAAMAGSTSVPSPAMRPSSSRRGSSSMLLPPGYMPSPQPSFRYVPVAYITPGNSAPNTPRISPVSMPSPRAFPVGHSSANASSSTSSTPFVSAAGQSVKVKTTGNVPSSIIAAALAIPHPSSAGTTATTTQVKRMSSRVKVLQGESLGQSIHPLASSSPKLEATASSNRGNSPKAVPPTPPVSNYASSSSSNSSAGSTPPTSPSTTATTPSSSSKSGTRSRSGSKSTPTTSVATPASLLSPPPPSSSTKRASKQKSPGVPPLPTIPSTTTPSTPKVSPQIRAKAGAALKTHGATVGGGGGYSSSSPSSPSVESPVPPPRRSSLAAKRASTLVTAMAATAATAVVIESAPKTPVIPADLRSEKIGGSSVDMSKPTAALV
ncbi:hypothetical protein BGZ59_010445 [Podila verticillata]|nr:hypothetical protein BGZ59_010445 [Podila verticillata]KFH67444.1 hypothetical protein MVEG_06176 [Podila verticillata NRRL 6337]